jgi:hypothetical protein
MSIKLLPASVNPVDPSQAPDVSTGLVLLTQNLIITRADQTSLVPPAAAFAWSSSTRRGETNCIDATPVDDFQSDETERSGWEYVSAWAWIRPIESTAIAHYLSYAGAPVRWNGWLINLYA